MSTTGGMAAPDYAEAKHFEEVGRRLTEAAGYAPGAKVPWQIVLRALLSLGKAQHQKDK